MVRQIRIGPNFLRLRNNLRRELEPQVGSISDRELTEELAWFIENEKLDIVMLRRAKSGRGRIFR